MIKSIALTRQVWNLPVMELSFLMLNCALLFLTINFTVAYKCRRINSSYLPSCANVGYNFTANFSDVGTKSYQEYVSSEVTIFANRFNSCSPLSKFFVCSRYVPKCSESVEGPVLPCREVCEQFVDDCATDLKGSGLYKSYVAYCRLLSSEEATSTNCIKPDGFVSRATKGEFEFNNLSSYNSQRTTIFFVMFRPSFKLD